MFFFTRSVQTSQVYHLLSYSFYWGFLIRRVIAFEEGGVKTGSVSRW